MVTNSDIRRSDSHRWGRHSCLPRLDVLIEPKSDVGVPTSEADRNVCPTNPRSEADRNVCPTNPRSEADRNVCPTRQKTPKAVRVVRMNRRYAGMTFAELVIGLTITTMISGAVAALMMSVSTGWKNSRTVEQGTTHSTQTMIRLQKVLRSAKQIGACRVGSISSTPAQAAAVLLWKGDLNGDYKVQFSELALIEHQISATPANAKIVYWYVSFPSTWTSGQKQAADSTLADNTIYDTSQIDSFKALANVRWTTYAAYVTAAEFHRIDSDTATRPTLEFELKFLESGNTLVKYGSTSSRSSTTRPTGAP